MTNKNLFILGKLQRILDQDPHSSTVNRHKSIKEWKKNCYFMRSVIAINAPTLIGTVVVEDFQVKTEFR